MTAKATNNDEKKVYLTPSGLQKLEDELKELTEHRRSEVAARIAQAKEYGDLSENSEYEAAKEEQAFVEGRIAQIQQMIKNAVIIDENTPHYVVELGSQVKVEDKNSKKVSEYTIVGSAEADPMAGKISNESPIGKALFGKKVKDVVDVEVPTGTRTLVILDIK